MKKLIIPMLVGGIIGHIITKQQNKISILKKDLKSSKETLQEAIDSLSKEFSKEPSNIRKSGRYPWGKGTIESIVFETRKEAEKVLSALEELISNYGRASIADLYYLAGIPEGNFFDYKWGWTDLSDASITQTKHGWGLNL